MFRLSHANVEQPDSSADTAATVAKVLEMADVATFNEANDASTRRLLRSYQAEAWSVFIPTAGPPENCIMWRSAQFRRIGAGSKVIMKGGVVNGRRRGPSRSVSWVVLEEDATRHRVIVATVHTIAKADTSARWRRPLRRRSFESMSIALARVMARHPHAELILTGDMNTIGKTGIPGLLPVREVKTPRTYSIFRYDRVYATSRVHITGVRAFRTRSDHKALTMSVALKPGI